VSASTETAVAAAVACAERLGVPAGDPVVLRDEWHVLVHLRPSPLVARVSSAIPFPEGPQPDDVLRELEVAGHAARAGAPVIPPAARVDPGPHRVQGRIVTFWDYVAQHGDPDPRSAGAGLRAVHEALCDCPAELPRRGHREDVETMLATVEPSDGVELLLALANSGPTATGQALHGDAHLDNCLQAADGPRWHDFESSCRGPCEYDLAALMLGDRRLGDPRARAALEAYGEHDEALLEALLPVYAAWVYSSLLVSLPRRPERAPIMADRLRWLRGYALERGLV
jgi:Phosphotransferase enzyme family